MPSIYAAVLEPKEKRAIKRAAGHLLEDEIDLLRTLINRTLSPEASIDIELIEAITKAVDTIARAMKVQRSLQPKQDDSLRQAFLDALDQIEETQCSETAS